MEFNVNRWTAKVTFFFVLVLVTTYSVYTTSDYIKIHKYEEYSSREIHVDELDIFLSEMFRVEEDEIKINMIDYSLSLIIDKSGLIEDFQLTTYVSNKIYRIDYNFNNHVIVERIRTKINDNSVSVDFNENIDLCYRQLNLSDRFKDGEYVNIVRMIELTKDFKYVEEDNFDKMSYIKNIGDEIYFKVKTGTVIKSGGVKYVVNVLSENYSFKERLGAIYFYRN